jgi:hypothetical protein
MNILSRHVIASGAKQSPSRELGIASGKNRPRNDEMGDA